MECGLIGLPGAGKTTLFNALTGSHAMTYTEGGTGALKPHVGVAKVPDPRLETIASFVETKRIVHASIQFVDLPGVPPGAEASKLNAFLSHARQVDAVCHVVRCFDPGGLPANPPVEIERMETELVVADLEVAESNLDKASRGVRSGDKDAQARAAVLEKSLASLNEGKPIRNVPDWSDAERVILKGYGLISAKPVVYVANVPEDDLAGRSSAAQAVIQYAKSSGGEAAVLCAKLESELTELNEADRKEMLQEMGLAESAIGPLARAVHTLLGLMRFYTVNEKEAHAWAVRHGATAPEAAGCVHSDMQRGFIRAECYQVNDLIQYKSEKAVREAGKLRSEGKHYQVQDGDVIRFLFHV